MKDVRRLELTSKAPRNEGDRWVFGLRNNLSTHRSDFTFLQMESTRFPLQKNKPSLTFVFLRPLFYGGIHLSAWDFEFPTPIELALWRASGIIVGARLFVIVGTISSRKLVVIWAFLLAEKDPDH